MADQALKLAKQKRNAFNMNCGKEIRKATARAAPKAEADIEAIETSISKLNDYRAKLETLNDQILLGTTDDDVMASESQKSADTDETILDCVSSLNAQLSTYRRSAAAHQVPSSPHNTTHNQSFGDRFNTIQLPKLHMAKFSGDPLKFQEFWDGYSSTIHDNDDLSSIDKFKYLRSFLAGDALRVIDGYRLTAENYQTVVDVLEERFGNKQLAVFSHLEAMLALPVANHDTAQLQTIYDDCERHIRSLIALGLEENMFGQVFTPIILSKLPTYVKMELHRRNGAKAWTLQNLRELLKDEIRARDMSNRTFGMKSSTERPGGNIDHGRRHQHIFNRHKPRAPTGGSASLLTNNANTPSNFNKSGARKPRCSFCSNDHFTDQCKVCPDLRSRKERISGRCFVCLSNAHMVKDCTNPRPCAYCQRTSHHRSLCPTKFGSKPDANGATQAVISTKDPGGYQQVNTTLLAHGETVILQTALANVKSVRGATEARLLFDTGSSRTFITTMVANKIGARYKGKEVISTAGFSDSKRKTKTYQIVEFDVVLPGGDTKTLVANIIPVITCPIQRHPVDPAKYPVIKQLVLAEPPIKAPQIVSVDILVGNDYYYDFIGTERIRCSDGLIFLSSPFGFIATGRLGAEKGGIDIVSAMCCIDTNEIGDSAVNIEKYWSLEDVGVKQPATSSDDEDALRHFNDTVTFEDGRYHVAWSYKKDAPQPPRNRALAGGRLNSLLNRISDDVFETYDKTIREQEQDGIIEQVPAGEPDGDVHYMPHHCVLTPGKSTTKLRIVYDASAKTNKSDSSLNDCLHRGPVLLDDLCGLIIRFRLYSVAIVSDIERAFFQVGLHRSSRDVTRFLWIKDRSQPAKGNNVVELRFKRVPFGVVSSPFELGAVINRHLRTSKHPVASEILGNIYVDNVIVCKKTTDDAKEFYNGAKKIFTEASMNLREWYTNDADLAKIIREEDRGKTETTTVLGLRWDTKSDTMSCSVVNVNADSINTKRLMLKYLAKVFDPCGWYSAVTITSKILIQTLWKQQYGWDDKLSDDLVRQWDDCWSNLGQISAHILPRCVNTLCVAVDTVYELHCFGDASAKAYSAVVYLKATSPQGVTSQLIFGKSRVAPVKSLTIPRLELMATLIGTRLLSFVGKELRIDIKKMILWSDSQCVLHWIQSNTVSTPFIKNRINEIKACPEIEFRYVPTKSNPADLSSRGVLDGDSGRQQVVVERSSLVG